MASQDKEPSPIFADDPDVVQFLTASEIKSCHLVPQGSNYTFQAELCQQNGRKWYGIYKPMKGETPLRDFPYSTLYKREYAAYLVSEAGGWQFVPPTVIRDGPHGIGSMQLFIEHRPESNFFSLRDQNKHGQLMKKIALYDAVTNNADRKGGHILEDFKGRLWCIDQGLTFNEYPKLRTVIWDYAGGAISENMLEMVRTLQKKIAQEKLGADLRDLLSPPEISALNSRIQSILSEKTFPQPGPYRNVPSPMI
ncbi:MAG: SCO1664 family protein [Dehalococcoidia bacterium]|nr:SCO1664 family protein [Dehalococcoidia bacterium]